METLTQSNLAWLGMASAVIGLCVQLLKTDILTNALQLDKKYYPWISLGLGILAAVVHNLTTGQSLSASVVVAISGAMATATHELGNALPKKPTDPTADPPGPGA